MRRVSKKTAARIAEAKPFREALIQRVGHCELCGFDPSRPREWEIRWRLCAHEIANGPHRLKALDNPACLLVTCWWCNSEELTDKKKWPEARQLAVLKRSRPGDYDLAAYLRLKNRNAPLAITEEEVDAWL